MRFDPAANIGKPIAINTIPKNGGGKGRNIRPTSKLSAPVTIKAIDFKRGLFPKTKPCDFIAGIPRAHYQPGIWAHKKNVQRHLINRGIAIVVRWVTLHHKHPI
ncbi:MULTISPECIES: hypothetical protein [Thalassospira]|uniref:Uncharacterized protein n=1 Tax=Thalassospira aquimaris TaxID=3037796 RepID=A0ABT6GG44_9PROT|nr:MULTISPECIES: hypothetical protein [Thalassospira]MDG4720975.1 hypothetical protein [Thalassospira sp. FZY0004]